MCLPVCANDFDPRLIRIVIDKYDFNENTVGKCSKGNDRSIPKGIIWILCQVFLSRLCACIEYVAIEDELAQQHSNSQRRNSIKAQVWIIAYECFCCVLPANLTQQT